ncbi:hypothetical protein BH09PSE6_BH09PSE6_26080 [soil metagenome]
MKPSLFRTAISLAASLLLAACASSPSSRYYVLSADTPPASQVRSTPAPRLETIRVAALTDRPQLVFKSGKQTVELREYDRWAEPFDQMVARVLRQDLEQRSGMADSDARPARLFVVIDEFMPSESGTVVLSGHWWTSPATGATVPSSPRRFSFDSSYDAGSIEAAVAAMSTLVARLADSIAANGSGN